MVTSFPLLHPSIPTGSDARPCQAVPTADGSAGWPAGMPRVVFFDWVSRFVDSAGRRCNIFYIVIRYIHIYIHTRYIYKYIYTYICERERVSFFRFPDLRMFIYFPIVFVVIQVKLQLALWSIYSLETYTWLENSLDSPVESRGHHH